MTSLPPADCPAIWWRPSTGVRQINGLVVDARVVGDFYQKDESGSDIFSWSLVPHECDQKAASLVNCGADWGAPLSIRPPPEDAWARLCDLTRALLGLRKFPFQYAYYRPGMQSPRETPSVSPPCHPLVVAP